MKIKRFQIALALSFLSLNMSFMGPHPIKLTASLIEYGQNSKSLRMICRVFIDDFQNSINPDLKGNIDIYNLSGKDKLAIEDYFNKYYSIYINDEKYELKYKDSKVLVENNIFTIVFSEESMKINKGDQICIENTLFFKDFAFLQSNMITLRIPPLIDEDTYETRHDDFSVLIDL